MCDNLNSGNKFNPFMDANQQKIIVNYTFKYAHYIIEKYLKIKFQFPFEIRVRLNSRQLENFQYLKNNDTKSNTKSVHLSKRNGKAGHLEEKGRQSPGNIANNLILKLYPSFHSRSGHSNASIANLILRKLQKMQLKEDFYALILFTSQSFLASLTSVVLQ